jgi:uncharacterized membrane protein
VSDAPTGRDDAPGNGASAGREAHGHHLDPVERTVRLVLLAGIAVSVALMAAGLVLGVVRGTMLPTSMVPLSALPSALAHLDPAAYVSLGLIVLVATPFVRVLGSMVAFAVERDRVYVLVTATVFVVMCLSVLLGRA